MDRETDISNNIDSSGPSSFNVKYYISSKRPPLTRLDENGEPISPFTYNSTISDTDNYYKGRWSIFVDVKNKVRDPTNPINFIDLFLLSSINFGCSALQGTHQDAHIFKT